MRSLFEMLILAAISVTVYFIYSFYNNYEYVKEDDFWQVLGVLGMFVVLCAFLVYIYYRYYLKDTPDNKSGLCISSQVFFIKD
ncbi:MAG: hypothetical protein WAZ12_05245 [Candidatus Absconditicoccaceae bacterium]